jgi:hypothetical protein
MNKKYRESGTCKNESGGRERLDIEGWDGRREREQKVGTHFVKRNDELIISFRDAGKG